MGCCAEFGYTEGLEYDHIIPIVEGVAIMNVFWTGRRVCWFEGKVGTSRE